MAEDLERRFDEYAQAWRDPQQIVAQLSVLPDTDMLASSVQGDFWNIIERLDITLIVTREYEHLVLALSVFEGRPCVTYQVLPHPSGVCYDPARGVLHIASTRNPNQLYEFAPVVSSLARADTIPADVSKQPLVPLRSRYLPGCFYIHDLALIDGALYANSVGQNAVVRIDEESHDPAWWPACMDVGGRPDTSRNEIQLNSIAAGPSVEESFFSASGDRREAVPPGHADYPVDGRGVIFSGRTREAVVRGLTRPHSARIHRGDVWVDNSGYGTLLSADVSGGLPAVVASLPGWTRGLTFAGDVAFVGTSRVIPRFRQYAPGLDVDSSRCGVHAVDVKTGAVLGSLMFPNGNQIFAVETVPGTWSRGFPFQIVRSAEDERRLFYAYEVPKRRVVG